jgi:predicted TIM-barrel fold metal-dependent hydrolase
MAQVIDVHAHAVSLDQARYPITPIGGQQSAWTRDYPVPAERLVAEMDVAGVDRAIVMQPATAYGYNNRYIADAAAAHPSRLTFGFLIDITAPDAAETLKSWAAQPGACAFWLYTPGGPEAMAAEDPATHDLLRLADRLGFPFSINTHPVALPRLRRVIEQFPAVTWTLDHLAYINLEKGPPAEEVEALFDLATLRNLVLKVSTRNLTVMDQASPAHRDFYRRLVDRFGVGRLLWGSNYTASHDRSYPEMVTLAKRTFSFLDQQEVDLIMGENARTIWTQLR